MTRPCRRSWNSSGRRPRSSMRRCRARRRASSGSSRAWSSFWSRHGLIPVDQVVTARGVVVAKSPTILVQPLETAIVRSIEVREGQQVQAGQVLARLDPTFAAADVATLEAQVQTSKPRSRALRRRPRASRSVTRETTRTGTAGGDLRPSQGPVRRQGRKLCPPH